MRSAVSLIAATGMLACASGAPPAGGERVEVDVSTQALDCSSDFDCWFSDTPVCAGTQCVECVNDGDCWGDVCRNSVCEEPLPPEPPEPPERVFCGDGILAPIEECDPETTNDFHCDPRTCSVQVAGAETAFDRCNPDGAATCTGETECSAAFGTTLCLPTRCDTIPWPFRQIFIGEGSALPFCLLDCSAASCPNNTSCRSVEFFGTPTLVCLP